MSSSILATSDFDDRARAAEVVGRWSKANEALPWRPAPRSTPHRWSYHQLRSLAHEVAATVKGEAGALRVLTMLNPGHPDDEAAVGHLYSGLQLLLPGEDMHAHRHAATAVRYVHESDGGWTAIDGTVYDVEPGDVVLTPAMLWHEHGNTGTAPVIWQDCTDDPLVTTLAASWFELHPTRSHLDPARRRDPAASLRLHFSWTATDAALTAAQPDDHGVRTTELLQPDGGPLSPTGAGTFLRLSPGASHTTRQTGARLLIVAAGTLTAAVGGEVSVGLTTGDTFAVPSWQPLTLSNAADTDTEATVFLYSEVPVLSQLGLYREEHL